MRFLVLGSSGFLGSNLFRYLSFFPEVEIAGASRFPIGSNHFVLETYNGATLRKLVDDFQPEVIINCVGMVGHEKVLANPQLAREANIELPQELARLSNQEGVRMIHFSSDSVYSGIPEEAPFSEDSRTRPFSEYGRQKLQSERVVLSEYPDAIVLRINFFGWSVRGDRGILDHFVRHALSGTNPIGYSAYTVTSIDIATIAGIILEVVKRKLSGTYNLGSADALSKLEFGRKVFSLLKLDPGRVIASSPSVWKTQGVSARDLSMRSDRIGSAIGLRIPGQEDGIRRTLNDLRNFLDFTDMPSQDLRFSLANRLELV